jgi:adenylylsulfate kinase-like enzyme
VIRGTPISKDVGFSKEDRAKHIKRIAWIAKMFNDVGITAICSFVSPDKAIRSEIRTYFDKDQFIEVFVDATIEECIKRDVKCMYKKAISGEIKNFTGIDAPYDKPERPEIYLNTSDKDNTVDDDVKAILMYLGYYREKKYSVYIGRWNGCYHLGHEAIINQSLEKDKNVLMLIRDVTPDEKNPWTAKQVKEMLDYRYKKESRVKTMIIPDISSVEYGRKVGYQVNEIKVQEQIASISGTKCRELIKNNDPSWKEYVHPRTAKFLEKEYN